MLSLIGFLAKQISELVSTGERVQRFTGYSTVSAKDDSGVYDDDTFCKFHPFRYSSTQYLEKFLDRINKIHRIKIFHSYNKNLISASKPFFVLFAPEVYTELRRSMVKMLFFVSLPDRLLKLGNISHEKTNRRHEVRND